MGDEVASRSPRQSERIRSHRRPRKILGRAAGRRIPLARTVVEARASWQGCLGCEACNGPRCSRASRRQTSSAAAKATEVKTWFNGQKGQRAGRWTSSHQKRSVKSVATPSQNASVRARRSRCSGQRRADEPPVRSAPEKPQQQRRVRTEKRPRLRRHKHRVAVDVGRPRAQPRVRRHPRLWSPVQREIAPREVHAVEHRDREREGQHRVRAGSLSACVGHRSASNVRRIGHPTVVGRARVSRRRRDGPLPRRARRPDAGTRASHRVAPCVRRCFHRRYCVGSFSSIAGIRGSLARRERAMRRCDRREQRGWALRVRHGDSSLR
jgi:hypothetical protein